jgi:hypothetical protein
MPNETFSDGAALFLIGHPDTLVPAVRCIEVSATRRPQGHLALSFSLCGDLSRLLIPPEASAERTDGLWQRTCFEAFVAVPGEKAYLEFNFSPSGQWAAYAFSDYRQRDLGADPLGCPHVRVERGKDRDNDSLTLNALLSADDLPKGTGTGTLQLGLSAVVEYVESVDGHASRLSYWALRHPGGKPTPKPDFHQRDTFSLELPGTKETLINGHFE